MLDGGSSSSRWGGGCPPRSSVWGSPSLSGRVGKCHKLPALIHGFHSGDQSLCPVAGCFSLALFFFSSILFFCPLFRSRFWLGRGTANTRLDLGTETTWIRAPQVLGYVQDEISQPRVETRPEFLNESRRRVPSPTCLLYPAVKWKIHSLDQKTNKTKAN